MGSRRKVFVSAAIFFGLFASQISVAQTPGPGDQRKAYVLSGKDSILTSSTGTFASTVDLGPSTLPSDADPQLTIGAGYDSMSDEVRPHCINETASSLPKAESEGQNGRILLSYVTSEDDIARSLGIEGNASFGMGAFSGDASVQYLNSDKINQYESYLLLTSYNENSKQILIKYTLTSAAKTALRAGLQQFVKLCGDKFVRGIITGGSLDAVISASSSTEDEQIDADATLHAAGWGGSVDVATQQKLESYRASGRLNVQILRQGPAEAWPSNDVNALIAYAQNFPAKVASDSKSAWVISYIVSDYDEDYNKWIAPQAQVTFFDTEGPYLRALYAALNNYDYILNHQDQFGPTSSVKLSNEINILQADITRVKHAADGCIQNSAACNALQHISYPSQPSRPDVWQALDPTNNSYRAYFTVVSPDQKILELQGQFYTQCQNHGAGIFGPTQWDVQFVSTSTGAVLYDGAYPGRPLRVPPNSQVNIHVIDAVPGDNCAVSDQEPKARVFVPVFPDDF